MKTDLTKIEILPKQSKEVLEQSMAIQLMKLFALTSLIDGVISEKERRYVKSFCAQIYPDTITSYLFSRYEHYLEIYQNKQNNIKSVVESINIENYHDKIYCFLKICELIIVDGDEEEEILNARTIAEYLGIQKADIQFCECFFGWRKRISSDLSDQTLITELTINNDPELGDVYFPIPGLNLVILKICNIFCIVNRGKTTSTQINNYIVQPDLSFRLKHGDDININNFTIKYHDLKTYVSNLTYHPEFTSYIYKNNTTFSFTRKKDADNLLAVHFDDSRITITPLVTSIRCTINNKEINTATSVNLNDRVILDNYALNLRELFATINDKKRLLLPSGNLILGNDSRVDIIISDELTSFWSCTLMKDSLGYRLNKGNCPYRLFVNNSLIQSECCIKEGDIIYLHNHFVKISTVENRITLTSFSFRKLIVKAIDYTFSKDSLILDNVLFDLNSGDMACIMGPSGCGKSTLLGIMSGLFRPHTGEILLDHYNLHTKYEILKDHLGFVPQDDILHPNLTVYENISYYARLRFPGRSITEIDSRIDVVLQETGLLVKKHVRVGDTTSKTLSGGEKKRLNIALELMANAEIYLLDEPTSGLSSKDSEKIIELLSTIALQGKIVIVVIHQPTSKVYRKFNKLIFLDRGGHLVYYGDTIQALEYFSKRREELSHQKSIEVECPHCKIVQPDLLLDSLEEPLRDVDGSPLEERKFSPQFWKKEFQQHRKTKPSVDAFPDESLLPPSYKWSAKDRFNQIRTLISRNYKQKSKDRFNLFITFIGGPILGASIGFITSYAPDGDYNLYKNAILAKFLFTTVIVTLFMGLANSIDEIIRDRPILLRERLLNVCNRHYYLSKLVVLMLFAIMQNSLYIWSSFYFLEIKELTIPYIGYLSLISLVGITLGLMISAIPNLTTKAAQNIFPLILIPQIILGGALIKFQEMNTNMIHYEESPIPEICQLMPSRWAFEGLILMQESFTSFHPMANKLLHRKRQAKKDIVQYKKAKQTTIQALGAEAYNKRLAELQTAAEDISIELEALRKSKRYKFGNSDIDLLVKEADTNNKQQTGINTDVVANPMFLSEKRIPFTQKHINTTFYNGIVLLMFSAFFTSITLLLLNFREGFRQFLYKVRSLFDR